ncbi:trypsin-1-like [Trichogramma pretiosum]|uniref:trypsin-1-like n=1 Tax=Trichogramma pretiosum TaxID=7493 RepID=UPI0006C97450|nr:trypsin-1-like [Trichogramma pretiosum]
MFTKLFWFSCIVAAALATTPRIGLRLPRWNPAGSNPSRIVGGNDASPGEFPHQVSLQWGLPPILPLSHMCGGSIISESWILTAAHCPKGVPFGNLYVVAGKYLIGSREATEQKSVVKKSYIHPKYPGNVAPYDIALLKLSTPLKFNEKVQPIALPKADVYPEGEVTLSGWGSTSTSQFPVMPDKLQKAVLPVVDLESCEKAIQTMEPGNSPLHETNVCTGPLTGGVSACSGDSGGPLIKIGKDAKPEVIGIVSWGFIPCGSEGAPSVYTRTSAHIDWIKSVIGES